MRIQACLFALALVLPLTACSGPSSSPSASTFSPPTAQPDQGLVVFYRPAAFKGKAIRFEVTHSVEGSIGYLSSGAVLKQDLAPGSHTFTARAPSLDGQDSVSVDVVAGEVYYVKGEILWGWPAGRPKFNRMSASGGEADLSRM